MKKFYCDICNKEVENVEEYIIPKQKKEYICDKHGNRIKVYYSTEKQKKDICPKCSDVLAKFIWTYMPVLGLSDDIFLDIRKVDDPSAKDVVEEDTKKTVSLYKGDFCNDNSWKKDL